MMRGWTVIFLALVVPCTAQVRFVPNAGQWPDHVHHRAEVRGGGIQLEADGWTCWQWVPADGAPLPSGHRQGVREGIVWNARFSDAAVKPVSEWKPGSPDPDRMNFYLSDQPERWAEGVQACHRIEAEQVWQGIGLRWRSTPDGHAKFEFTVEPHADPRPIAWRYAGIEPRHGDRGTLLLRHALHRPESGFSAMLEAPFAYQLSPEGTLMEVECRYRLKGAEVGFELGSYDPTLPLVIDPEIVFASSVGSMGDNFGATACNGPGGSLVGASLLFAPGYPVTPDALQSSYDQTVQGDTHIGLTLFSPDGANLLYSTYLGGDHCDYPHSLAFESDWNRIAVMGTTGSLDFPTTPNAFQSGIASGAPVDGHWNTGNPSGSPETQPQGVDYFLSSFDAVDFTLEASTYFGGSAIDGWNGTNFFAAEPLSPNYGDLLRGQVDIGPDGSIWLAGTTWSTDIPMPGSPAAAGGRDGLVAGFSPDLSSLLCGRYVGGSADDAAFSIEVAPDNSFGSFGNLQVLVGGGTQSTDLPLPPGGMQSSFQGGGTDGWVGIFLAGSNSLTFQNGSYVGSNANEQVYFVQRDFNGAPYTLSRAPSGLTPIGTAYSNGTGGLAFTCFFNDLSDIQWQTNIGGTNNGQLSPTAFLVSECRQIYFSGWGGPTGFNSNSTVGWPVTDDAFQTSTNNGDFYLGVLSPDAVDLVYGTFLGGPNTDEHLDGGTCRFDPDGTVYHAACADCSAWNDFPTTPGAWCENDPSPSSGPSGYDPSNPFSTSCNMGVFKFELGKLNANISIDGPDQFCQGESVQFVNLTAGPAAFTWDFGDATFSNEVEPLHLYGLNGTFEVEVIAEDTTGCLAPDTAYVTVTIAPDADPAVEPVDPLCLGDATVLLGSGNGTLSWFPPTALSDVASPNPTANPTTTTTYTLTDETLCGEESTEITVEVIDMATSTSGDTQICLGDVVPLEISSPVPGAENWSYAWFPPDGLSNPFSAGPMASPDVTTTYSVTVTSPEGCIREHEITVDVVPSAPGGMVYPTVDLCDGQSIQLGAEEGSSWSWSPTTGLNNPASQTPFASPAESTTYLVTITNLCGSGTDEVTVNVIVPQAFVSEDGWICAGEAFPVSASGGVSYQWVPGALVTQPGAAETTVVTQTTQTFTAYVTDADGCVASAELTVHVWPRPTVEAGPDQRNDWMEPTFLYGSVDGAPIDSLWWSPPEPLSCSDCLIPEVVFQEDGVFTLHVIDTNGCRSYDVVEVEFLYPLYVPSAFTPDADGLNDGWRPEGHWLNGAGTYLQGLPDDRILPGYRVEIWDRWGTLIWSSVDPRAHWTGGVGGPGTAPGTTPIGDGQHAVPAGVYTWRVRYPTSRGIQTAQGKVTVIR